MFISISSRLELNFHQLNEMHKLRAKIFKERKGWDVTIIADMEIDGYDALNPYYLIIQGSPPKEQISGCWRILPTTGPYMLEHTFPELLHGVEAPKSENVWELSRFAIQPKHKSALNFSDDSIVAIKAVVEFAMNRGVVQFVTVTTLGVEKLLRRQGLDISRFGPAIRIGVENAIALRIELNDMTRRALVQQAEVA